MKLEILEQYRMTSGFLASKKGDLFGLFFYTIKTHKSPLKIIASPFDGKTLTPYDDWQHVSVSLPDRCPTWNEMCTIKDLFWGKDKCVVQYHPPQNKYINNYSFCLHLWHWTKGEFPMPPIECV